MRRELPSSLRWLLLALLGLAVAVAVGIAASELTSRRIGLSSEPMRAGDALAPEPQRRVPESAPHDPEERKERATTPQEPPPATTTTAPPQSTTSTTPDTTTDDYGGETESDDD